MTNRSRCSQHEPRVGVVSEGIILGTTSHSANCCARHKKEPRHKEPMRGKPAQHSQMPKATPTSDIPISVQTCHRCLRASTIATPVLTADSCQLQPVLLHQISD